MIPRSSTVTVTYHLHKEGCIAETVIDIPLKNVADAKTLVSQFGNDYGFLLKRIHNVVNELAVLRGYKRATIQDIRYAEQKEGYA